MSVLNSMKQPGAKAPENPVDKLCTAAWNNQLTQVRQMLNEGNINAKNSRGKVIPVYLCSRFRSVPAVLCCTKCINRSCS